MNKSAPTQGTGNLVSLGERESLLRNQPGFSTLSVNDTAVLSGMMQEVTVQAGEPIVTQGELIDSVYILVSGSAEVTQEVVVNKKTGTSLLATLHDGDSIGLKNGQFFSQTGSRTATVTASGTCILLKLGLTELKDFLETRPELMENLHSKSTWMLRMQMIKQAAPFANLNNQQLAGLASNVKEVRFPAGETIFKQGDLADSCYLIAEGKVEVSQESEDGTKTVLAELTPYSLLGEAAFLKQAKRSATARCLSACNMLLMDKDALLELASEEEAVSDTLLTIIRGHCRPRRLEDVIYQQRTSAEGQQITTLKNTKTNRYLQLNDAGWFIWTQMNGQLTSSELSKLFFKQFADKANNEEFKQIVQQLVDGGFASIDNSHTIAEKTSKEDEERSLFSRLFNFSYFLPNADKKIGFLYKNGGHFLFSIPGLLLQGLLILAGFYFFSQSLPDIIGKIKTIKNMPLCLFAVVVVSMCYQLLGALIKALSIKYFDREVPNFGLVWYKIGPVAVVDTSDMWLSSAWPQFAVSLAGVLANLLLAGLMAWYATYTTEAATAVFAFLAALFIYLQTLRSLDPLLNSDGYEMLCNITDSPHLRSIALKWLLREKGIEGMQHRQERFFWLSVLLYFCLVILVTQLLLGYLLYAIPGLSGLSHYVWLALIACCALELGLAIQFHKQTSLQRAA